MPSALCPVCSAVLTAPGRIPSHPDWGTGHPCAAAGRSATDWIEWAPEHAWMWRA